MSPVLIAEVRLYSTAEGGRNSPICPPHLGCPAEIQGEFFDCRIYVDEPLAPAETRSVAIQFLSPHLVLPLLTVRATFRLWERQFFGEATVLDLPDLPIPERRP